MQQNFDVLHLLNKTQNFMKDKKNINEYGTFMTNNDKYVEEEKIAYLID